MMRSKPKPEVDPSDTTDPAVIDFLDKLDHPLKPEFETVRRIILGVSPEIREGIKWNAPSFRTTDDFATLNLRQGRLWLILHTGAKVKPTAQTGLPIPDPTHLLGWLANDRAVVKFTDAADVQAKRGALESVLREWVGKV